MHLSLGGIVKGITTGLETLAETGNPIVAAGAGAVACLTDNGNAAQAQTPSSPSSFNPLLEQLRADNPFERQHVNALADYAGLVAA